MQMELQIPDTYNRHGCRGRTSVELVVVDGANTLQLVLDDEGDTAVMVLLDGHKATVLARECGAFAAGERGLDTTIQVYDSDGWPDRYTLRVGPSKFADLLSLTATCKTAEWTVLVNDAQAGRASWAISRFVAVAG